MNVWLDLCCAYFMIHCMMGINEHQDKTFTSRSNIYVCDNNGCDLYLLGVNALVKEIPRFG